MIKRYEWGHSRGLMNEVADGDFVLFADHLAEMKALKQDNWTAEEWKIIAADWQRRLKDADRLNVKLTAEIAVLSDNKEICQQCMAESRKLALEEAAQLMEITSQWVYTPDELAANIRSLAESV